MKKLVFIFLFMIVGMTMLAQVTKTSATVLSVSGEKIIIETNPKADLEDLSGTVPVSQLPPSAFTTTTLFSVPPAGSLTDLTSAINGDMAIVTDSNQVYILSGADPAVSGNWTALAITPDAVIAALANKADKSNGAAQITDNNAGGYTTLGTGSGDSQQTINAAINGKLATSTSATRSIFTTAPLSGGGDLSADRTLSISLASGTTDGYLSSVDWTTFNGKQTSISLTTTGNSGAATFAGATLNIPNYTLAGLGGQPALTNPVTASTVGTLNFVPKFTAGTTIANSQIFDNGTNVGIGTATPGSFRLDVNGTGNFSGALSAPTATAGTSTTQVATTAFVQTTMNTSWRTTTGNTLTGTLPASPNEFIGSANAADLVFRTNNIERMRMANSNGRLNVGTIANTGSLNITSSSIAPNNVPLVLRTNDAVPLAMVFQALRTGPVGNFFAVDVFNGSVGVPGNMDFLASGGILSIGYSDLSSLSEKLEVNGNIRAIGFKTLAGTSSQFLKADGSVTGGTTVGTNMLTLTNPSAVRFPRFNADNTVTALDAVGFRTAIGVGTVTQVNALTIGTAGANITSTVANSTTTPTITLNVPDASATARGALTTANWTTFNNKQNAISLTTTANSGAATFVGATLNVPNYTLAGLGGQTALTGTGLVVSTAGTISYTTDNSIIWNTAFAERNQWNGGPAGLFAADGRTSLGATTIGASMFTLANPSAVRFPRFNADNTVTALDAVGFRTSIGAGTVTAVNALTITAAAGANITSTVANGTTTPTITLNVPDASATQRGALTAADWTTFNNKQNAISLTTTGNSGAATLVGTTLNIPNYASGGLQTAYENSTPTEITTNTTNGAITIRRGSASDADNVWEVLNGAGTEVFSVGGDGYLFSNGFSEIRGGAEALRLGTIAGHPNYAYMGIYARTVTPFTVSGRIGYVTNNSNDLFVSNDILNGNTVLDTAGPLSTIVLSAPAIISNGPITSPSFIKSGGTSNQYLLANGDVTTASPSGWTLTGNAGTDSVNNFLGTTDGNAFTIKTNSIQRLLLAANGNVMVGSYNGTPPGAGLEVRRGLKTDIERTMLALTTENDSLFKMSLDFVRIGGANQRFEIKCYNDAALRTNIPLSLQPSGGGVAVGLGRATAFDATYSFFVNGKAGGTEAWAVSSDKRLKKNILPVENGLNKVLQMKPVTYDKKSSLESSDYNIQEIGFIAQELKPLFPIGVVNEGQDKDKLLSVNYTALIPVLTKAIQEQQKIIETEKAKNDKQQKEIENQQKQIDELRAMVKQLLEKK